MHFIQMIGSVRIAIARVLFPETGPVILSVCEICLPPSVGIPVNILPSVSKYYL